MKKIIGLITIFLILFAVKVYAVTGDLNYWIYQSSLLRPVSTLSSTFVGVGGLKINTSSYVNWGSTTGTNGYGLRDNAGNIQFKFSGGAWTDLSGAVAETDPIWSAFLLNPIFTNLTSTNFFATNTQFINATSTNLYVSSLANLTGLTFSTASGTSITSTNFFTTNFSATNGSFTNLTSTNLAFTNASGTAITTTQLRVNNIARAQYYYFTDNTSAFFSTDVGGIVFNGGYGYMAGAGTGLYVQNASVFRGALSNDTGSALTINGGTSGITSFVSKIGINSSSPIATLGIKGIAGTDLVNVASSTNAQLFVVKSNGQVVIGPNSLAQTGHQTLEHPTTNDYALTFTNGTHYTAALGRQPGTSGQMFIGGLSGTTLNLWAGGSSRMVILNTNGYVGINSSTPSTQFVVVGTSTFNGAILQTGLTDCDGSTQTVLYDLTTGQFSCGVDDNNEQRVGTSTANYFTFYDTATSVTGTSWVQFSGGALTVTTNTNFIIVSSTDGLFGSVTTTNLAVTGALTLPANSITDAMVVAGLTISGGTIDNSPIGATVPSTGVFTNLTSTNFFATNTGFISVTTTNLFVTSTVLINATSTNLYISSLSNFAGAMTFTTASGTSITSTNAFFDSLVFTNASGTSITTTNANFTTLNVSASTTMRTSTISGGFFQTGLTDCDLETQTVSYDLDSGKFGCLADATGSGSSAEQRVMTSTANYFAFYTSSTAVTGTSEVLFSGGALRVTTNTNFTIVSSTSGLFISATSTNLFATTLTFTNASGTTLTSTSGIFTNLTFTNATGTTLYLSSSFNLNNALTINSAGNISTSGTLRVYLSSIFGDGPTTTMIYRQTPANRTTSIDIYLSDPEELPRGTGVASTYMTYFDDPSRILVWSSVAGTGAISLKIHSVTPANTNLDAYYNDSGTLQTITATTLGGNGSVIKGAITCGGYHYAMVTSSAAGVSSAYIKRATSTWYVNLAAVESWNTSTISGFALTTSSPGILGCANNNIYVATSTTKILPYAITTSTNTLTAGSPITITGASLSVVGSRVNDNGIYAEFGSAPFIRKFNFSGTQQNTFGTGRGQAAVSATGPNVGVSQYSFYVLNGAATALKRQPF